jgi:hypothetical protein
MRLYRYGVKILELSEGTWFWSELLSDINFVPKGKRASTHGTSLYGKQNNRTGAIVKAARMTVDMIMKEEI